MSYRLVFKNFRGKRVKTQIVSLPSYNDARRYAQNLMDSGVLDNSIMGILVELCI